MKVLMISTDKKLFEKDSHVRARMVEYGRLFEELHVVVFSLRKLSFSQEVISENTTLYPTNSLTKLGYIRRAKKVGASILGDGSGFVISTQDPFETGLVGLTLKKKANARLQIQMHGDFWSPYFRSESFMNKIRLRIAKKVVRQADCIRVVSERIKESLRSKFGIEENVVVLPIYNFQNSSTNNDVALEDTFEQFDFLALMASRLEDVKNVELAIEAFAEVLKKYPTTGLVIVGDGSCRVDLEMLAAKLNIQKQVIFTGWQKDIQPYLKRANLFLNTSNHEGYCLSLIEAAQAKCPVLSTDVGVVGEVLNESNILVCPVGDKDCFAKKIISGIENRAALAKLGDTAFIDVKSNSNTKEHYLRRYRESIESCA